MFFFIGFVLCVDPPAPWGPTPTQGQLNYHREELSAFIHYGMNTFTGKDWGDGKEDPNLFKPTNLDTDQWVSTLKNAGFKRIIMIGRHHDGFCLWKSKYTDHQVNESTDFQSISQFLHQSGDVIEEVSKSCTKYDMNMGFYLSPWDRNSTNYGKEVEYNEYYMNQLTEILGDKKYGNNGKFVEVWMDGAKGTGEAEQKYWFVKWFELIENLQPGAVVFSPYASTIRWIGNEAGRAGETCWSKLNLTRQRNWYDEHGGDESQYLNQGDPNGDIWSTGECDVSLTSGWFWKKGNVPKTMRDLTTIYFSSVGRGQPFLLNVPPNTDGSLQQDFVDRLNELHETIEKSFSLNLAASSGVTFSASQIRGDDETNFGPKNVADGSYDTYWTMNDGQLTGTLTIDLGTDKKFDMIAVSEHIALGQRVTSWNIEYFSRGSWKLFDKATTIGAKRILRQSTVTSSKVRINIFGSQAVPLIEFVGIYKAYGDFSMGDVVPDGLQEILAAKFKTTGKWNTESEGIYTTHVGDTASATFKGTKAYIVGIVDSGHGVMDVYIDDVKVGSPNTYSQNRQLRQLLFQTDTLEDKEHTIKVVLVSKAIALHGFYILNNNGAGIFEIEKLDYDVSKGDSVTLTVVRNGGSVGSAQVTFQTSPGSAVHGRHYVDLLTDLVFANGETKKQVTVETIKNTEVTGNLTFFCEIVNPTSNALVGFNSSSTVTIYETNMDRFMHKIRHLKYKVKNNSSIKIAFVTAAAVGVVAVVAVISFFVIKRSQKNEEKIYTKAFITTAEQPNYIA
ncbi:FucA [Tritrichomonas foetus]|uniref:alpha-L-fucosidase n=1 Tax=Tritrichomonas foetus TaxID=1144522 RepID=A0A1J4J9R8_9EUKA|nr:FucA [Tritrichomonas foetus]|eukprot:OHS93988.1 FucA [Tritrichomonas foetus]